MKNEISDNQKAYIDVVLKLAKKYNVKIEGVVTIRGEVYIRYEYADENEFNEFVDELKKVDKKFEVISDKGKAESYTV